MSIQENQISDQIDGGLVELKRVEETTSKFYKDCNFNKTQTDYELFLREKTFTEDSNFWKQCRELLKSFENES